MLQGTLDVFSLDEVLGLLSGAGKTGVLNVAGDRGTGSIALRDGLLTDAEAELASGDVTITSVAFELLRFQSGSFTFEARSEVAGEDPQDLDSIMAAAHSRLSEWRSIEAVVPSLRHMLRLAPDLGGSDVTIDQAEWATIVAVGEGSTVGATSDGLGLGEVDGSRQVKGLIERGLLLLDEPEYEPASELPMRTSLVELPLAEPIDELAEYVTLDSPDQLEPEPVKADVAALLEPVLDVPVVDESVVDESVLDESMASFDEAMFAPVTEAPEEADAAAAAGLLDDIAEPDPFARRADDTSAPAAPADLAAEATPEAAEFAADPADDPAGGSLLMRYLKSNG